MDQIQDIICAQNEVNAEQAKFFSIKIIRLSKGRESRYIRRSRVLPEEEVMIQISDISLRIQSQYLKMER